MKFHIPLHSTKKNNEKNETPTDPPPSFENSMSTQMSNSRSSPSTPRDEMGRNRKHYNESIESILDNGNQRKSVNELVGGRSGFRKNVPYTPSSSQQNQIELLEKRVTKNGNLSPETSNTHTEYFDILPSFQMFQSILKRDDNQFSEDLVVEPPEYGDTEHSYSLPTQENDSRSERRHEYDMSDLGEVLPDLGNNYYQTPENVNFEAQDEAQEVTGNVHIENQNLSVTHDTYGHTVLDNIDRLPRSASSPLDIQIFVTKQVPVPHQTNELETRLKEYSSGDMVNGYIVITNKSDKPVDFGLFIVSLEGTVKATERKQNVTISDSNPYKKILMRKFLKMYDLNASYGYVHIPSSAGVEYECFTVDENDGCQIGLPNERILEPHKKYKKFFTFKFPEKLLDNTCLNDILPHILPPPSFGFDRTCFYNRGHTVELNKALGYGFLNRRGTPLLTKDYAFEDISISYTIEAKFIDKLNAKDQKDALSENEINDPNSNGDYIISKSDQYFLRFIPDIQEQLRYYNADFNRETYQSIGIDGKLFHNYLESRTWRAIESLFREVHKEIEAHVERSELTDDMIKAKNLVIDNAKYRLNDREKVKNIASSTTSYSQESEFNDLRMIGSKTPVEIYGKKKKKILSSLVKIGESKMYVQVPNKAVPYASPKLLMKYNDGSSKLYNSQKGGDSDLMGSTFGVEENGLMPVTSIGSLSSNMSELYHRDETEAISEFDLELMFTGTDNSIHPPQIRSVETNLIFWSYNTEYPLPVELSYDFFYNLYDTQNNPQNEHPEEVEVTRRNLQHIKDQTYNCISFAKSAELELSRDSFLFLKSMKSLAIKKDVVKDFFTSYNHIANPDNLKTDWTVKQSTDGKFSWSSRLTIPLRIINKRNINLIPTFETCLVGRIYCLQVILKYRGGSSDENDFASNTLKVDVPVLVG